MSIKSLQVKKTVHWVGYVDWTLRNFHGYLTQRGSSYNAYLLTGKKNILIDTVKSYGYETMAKEIKEIIPPSEIDYLICNHAEMDHSGNIIRFMQEHQQIELIISPKGLEHLKLQFPKKKEILKERVKVVSNKEVMQLGQRKLQFFLTPMVHWPDNMHVFSFKDQILFSNDAFGQHYAASEIFADQVPYDTLMYETMKYYANIVMPYGAMVKRALKQYQDEDLLEKTKMIAPAHGLIWRKSQHITKVLEKYQKWANNDTKNQAIIVYDSMWGSTKKIVNTLKHQLHQLDIPYKVLDLKINHISDIATHLQESQLMFIGTPIMNTQILPTIGELLVYLKGLKPKKRTAITFGSYGWSKSPYQDLEEDLEKAGFNLPLSGFYTRFRPTDAWLEKFSQEIRQYVSENLT